MFKEMSEKDFFEKIPYHKGAKVTLLGDVRIGDKIYQRGDILTIEEVMCNNGYKSLSTRKSSAFFGENEVIKYSDICVEYGKTDFILTDGKGVSDKTSYQLFIVGELDEYDLAGYDGMVEDRQRECDKWRSKLESREKIKRFKEIIIGAMCATFTLIISCVFALSIWCLFDFKKGVCLLAVIAAFTLSLALLIRIGSRFWETCIDGICYDRRYTELVKEAPPLRNPCVELSFIYGETNLEKEN